MKELKIAQNMQALARKKGGNKRSAMLRMIMPHLSQTTGEQLADAIQDSDSTKFGRAWDKVKSEIQHTLNNKRKHRSHSSGSFVALEVVEAMLDEALEALRPR